MILIIITIIANSKAVSLFYIFEYFRNNPFCYHKKEFPILSQLAKNSLYLKAVSQRGIFQNVAVVDVGQSID